MSEPKPTRNKAEVFIHPLALVETQQIGRGTYIWAFTHVMKNVPIGINCNIGEHCFIESGAEIGNAVTIKNGNMLWSGIKLQDGVFIGPNVSLTNDRFPRSPRLAQAQNRYSSQDWCLPTVIGQGASIGAGAVILPGLTIGVYAMVGAGAIVTKDVPPYALVIGNPARVKGWVCQCGQPLHFQRDKSLCCTCGLCYCKQGDYVELQECCPGLDGKM
jgi:acetyltransferase-like isoleucine patch superfamily enzyme